MGAIEAVQYEITDDMDCLLSFYHKCCAALITGKENDASIELKERVRKALLKDVELEF